jgi:hypothetical protein
VAFEAEQGNGDVARTLSHDRQAQGRHSHGTRRRYNE